MQDDRPSQTKCFWSPEEDLLLQELVRLHGPKKWSVIARSFKNRIGKQCRERWHNHLNPDVRKDAWTSNEDSLIIELVDQIGSRWAAIAKRLPGRTDNSIKNRYYSHLKKLHEQQKGANRIPDGRDSPSFSERPLKQRRLSLDQVEVIPSQVIVTDTMFSGFGEPDAECEPIYPTFSVSPDHLFGIAGSQQAVPATISSQALRRLLQYANRSNSGLGGSPGSPGGSEASSTHETIPCAISVQLDDTCSDTVSNLSSPGQEMHAMTAPPPLHMPASMSPLSTDFRASYRIAGVEEEHWMPAMHTPRGVSLADEDVCAGDMSIRQFDPHFIALAN